LVIPFLAAALPDTTLNHQIEIQRTRLVMVETEIVRMRQVIEAQHLRAPGVHPVQKRAMSASMSHAREELQTAHLDIGASLLRC
jgi:hypothetical protein